MRIDLKLATTARPKAGRPTRAQQEERHATLLEAALEHFLDVGYDAARVDLIALGLGMSKRTVYSLYPDKAALFKAAVLRAIERHTVPADDLESVVTGELRSSLIAIARQRVATISAPISIKLQRILGTQVFRFPDLDDKAREKGLNRTAEVIANVFRTHAAKGEIDAPDPERLAIVFLSFVVGIPARNLIRGGVQSVEEIETMLEQMTDIFLYGTAPR